MMMIMVVLITNIMNITILGRSAGRRGPAAAPPRPRRRGRHAAGQQKGGNIYIYIYVEREREIDR